MAVRSNVVLLADGGDVTVSRDAATFVYGEFRVIIPEGRDQVETDQRLQDGYIYRPRAEIAPFDIGFSRADVTIDLEVQSTDLELVVDQAQRNAEGDIFFERDISRAGLSEYVPGVDFHVGDVVTVELRSRRMLLPVVEIAMVASESDGPVGWRVRVGGMLISDADELRRRYDAVRRQVANDRRQLERSVSRVRSNVTSLREVLGGPEATPPSLLAQLIAVNEQIAAQGGQPQPGLLGNFISLSTQLWEFQQRWNREREVIDARQDAQTEALEAALAELERVHAEAERKRPRAVFAEFFEYQPGYVDPEGFVRIEPTGPGDRGVRFDCLGDWTGQVVVRSTAVFPGQANSIDSVRLYVTADSRKFGDEPKAIHMSYQAIDMTIFPD